MVQLGHQHLLEAARARRRGSTGTGSGGAGGCSRPRALRRAPLRPRRGSRRGCRPSRPRAARPRLRAVDLDRRDLVRDARDLLGAQLHHALVVRRVVGDVAGDVLLLEAADAVLEARRARDRPGARQGLGVAPVGLEVLGVGAVRDLGARQRRRRPGSARAPRCWRGSRPRARPPASCTSTASAKASRTV